VEPTIRNRKAGKNQTGRVLEREELMIRKVIPIKKVKKMALLLCLALTVAFLLGTTAFAANRDAAGAIEGT